MKGANITLGDLFERWGPTALLAAGGVWLVDSTLYALDLFGGVSVPGTVNGTLILTALLLTQFGVLGRYNPVTDEAPRMAAIGGLVVGITGLVTVITFSWMLGAVLVTLSVPPGMLFVGLVLGSLLGLALFGLASVRADAPSRTAGGLLVLLAAAWSVWAVTGLFVATPGWSPIVFGLTFSVVTGATGYVLRAGTAPTGERAPAGASATR